ncbi:MAG TPA: glycosyltransferase [Tepidisphaeraceae bacterium]
MKVLNVHNVHAHPGGMEVVFTGLTRLLRGRGHDVVELSKDNTQLKSLFSKLAAFGGAIYSPSVYREVRELAERQRPAVAHVHNLYPQFSTSALDALHDAGVPVILHAGDYKLTCPTAQHLRHGTICEQCLGGREWNAAIHNCRGNLPMSVAYAARNAWARVSGSVHRAVSVYACPTRFVADLLVRGGYPADRVRVLPNFLDLPDAPPPPRLGDCVGYLGRISGEKGIDVLIEAARITGCETRIAGDATHAPALLANLPPNATAVGRIGREGLDAFFADLRVLVVPSVWYEVFGLVCIEALSRGVPVIASDIGGLPEVVTHERTGLLVPPGDAAALSAAIRRVTDDEPFARALGARGREVVRESFSAEAFYRQLQSVWDGVLSQSLTDVALAAR